jgi:flagellar hook-associated protein 2
VASVSSAAANAPLSVSGLASGLNTSQIISSLLSIERQPVTRLTNQQTTFEGQEASLRSLQVSLTQLSFAAQELGSPILFHPTQSISSSNPTQVSATTSSGAAVGGYEVEVSQLANSGQRTFTFASPGSPDTLTIEGEEFEVPAGMTIQALVNEINSDAKATVYAAAPNNETLVLSTRATGATGPGFITVSDKGSTLVEQPALAKEGHDAHYTVDGAAATSKSNVVTSAIPGVSLSLKALTTVSGPVTIVVEPPAPNKSAIVAQVQSFVSLYNSALAAMNTQVQTKPPSNPLSAAELQTGTLYGDSQLMGLMNSMRQSVYETQAGQPTSMSSLLNIGISTGASTGHGNVSQGAVEGQLTLNLEQLEGALETNPSEVQQMLRKWSTNFQKLVNDAALPGGSIEARITSDSGQVNEITQRISQLNEAIALHQRTLQAQFAAMEAAVSRNQAQSSFLAAHLAGESSSGKSSSSSL